MPNHGRNITIVIRKKNYDVFIDILMHENETVLRNKRNKKKKKTNVRKYIYIYVYSKAKAKRNT